MVFPDFGQSLVTKYEKAKTDVSLSLLSMFLKRTILNLLLILFQLPSGSTVNQFAKRSLHFNSFTSNQIYLVRISLVKKSNR